MMVLPFSSAGLEFAKGGVDVLHDAPCLLEGKYFRLEVAVQHPPVGDDDDGVEDAVPIGGRGGWKAGGQARRWTRSCR